MVDPKVLAPMLVEALPDELRGALLTGANRLVGSAIQAVAGPNAGRVVAWLREVATHPTSETPVATVLGPAAGPLGYIGTAPSVVHLGATIAYGEATLRALARLDKRLGQLEQKLDRLRWTVEVGFATTLRALESLENWAQLQVAADLQTAASLADLAQQAERGSPQQLVQLNQALGHAMRAAHVLSERARGELDRTVNEFSEKRTGRTLVAVSSESVTALARLRQAALAASVLAKILAETTSPAAAADSLEGAVPRMREQLTRVGRAFLRPSDETFAYAALLNFEWADRITARRVDAWARRFDPEIGGLAGMMEFLRNWESEFCLPNVTYRWNQQAKENLPRFVDLLDGAWADLERLAGHAIEYREAAAAGLSIQEHRERMKVEAPEAKPGGAVVLLSR